MLVIWIEINKQIGDEVVLWSSFMFEVLLTRKAMETLSLLKKIKFIEVALLNHIIQVSGVQR